MTENDQVNPYEIEVAVTGSPNTVTEVHFDVRNTHLHNPLLGTLVTLKVPIQTNDSSEELLVLGQVASIETKNRWHEDISLKNYIKLHGRLPHLTEIGDNSNGIFQVLGAYRRTRDQQNSEELLKVRLSVPPGSGLSIKLVDPEIIQTIMQRDFGYGYLGNFYGTNNVPAPVYIRHFGDYNDRGSGEAYMGGVFGPSGSGKSVIAASLIALWSSNPQMGILILDPQSEFSQNAFARGTSFNFDFHRILSQFSQNRFDPSRDVISLDQIKLEGVEIFTQILVEKGFFRRLGVPNQKVSDSCEYIERFLENLRESNNWNTSQSWEDINLIQINTTQTNNQPISFSTLFCREVANSYAASSRASHAQEFLSQWNTDSLSLGRIWNETVGLFLDDANGSPRYQVNQLLENTVLNGQIKILDLNPETINMGSSFKLYLMDFIFKKLRQLSYIHYRQNQPGNCLIVLDEAGRFIPQDTGEDDTLRALCKKLTDSVKEMRKMRCGFMFITQTVAEIQKEIFRNLHFRIYGVGLGIGVDAEHLRAREGNDAYELYHSLPDPRLSGTFSFMVSGVLLALGSSGRPMIIEGYNSSNTLIENNQHLISNQGATALDLLADEPF